MIHGVLMFHGGIPDSRVWDLAINRRQLIALYTSRDAEREPDRAPFRVWEPAFVHSLGEPKELDPEGYGQRPGYRSPYGEYARYEPTYSEQFTLMCQLCSRSPTVVLPTTGSDNDALSLLADFEYLQQYLWSYLYERFYVIRREGFVCPRERKLSHPTT
jgi:hypothetical protein